MKKLTILQITSRLPWPLNDGGNIATYNVTKQLHDLGHNVILASFNTSKHFVELGNFPAIATIYTTNINNDIHWKGLIKSFFTKYNYVIKRYISKEFTHQLIEIIKKHNPDIIHIEGIYMSLYIDIIRKHTNAKIVLRAHNIESEIWKRLSIAENNLLKKKYLALLHKQIEKFELDAFLKFDGIVAITERDAGYVLKYFSQQNINHISVETINAGVDTEMFQKSKNEINNNQICFLGSLEWAPNVQGLSWFLTKVWPQIIEKKPELELHIAGKNPSSNIEGLNQKGIIFHGQVADAVAFLNNYSIMIVPLLSGGGMRLKIIEALSMKMAIISTSIGAEGINYIDGENLIIANSEKEFERSIENLVSEIELITNISENAFKLSSQYSWQTLIKKLEKFYISLISKISN